MRPAHIAPVIEDSLKLLRPLLGELIEVEFRHANSLPWLVADTGMLEQVVVNLAVNARDAMPEGGRLTLELDAVQITPENLAIHPCGREGRFVRLTMHDTGQGIEPKMLSQIFQPFFTTKEVGKGSGLGLATVYGIVEQHNGWIEVESTPGEGSLFTIFLPAQDGPEPKPEVTQPLPTSSASAGSETILLVEDEPLARQKITHSLESTGYRVLAAESGPGALAIWSGHAGDIDLLLSDLVMPGGLSGFELAERLRRDKPMLKVIVSSGYNVELAIQNLERCGIEYLPKPYNARALAAAVRTCLDRKNPFAPAAIRPQAEEADS
jgi:CheY-like chemotaxis protein